MGFSDDGYDNVEKMVHFFIEKRNMLKAPYDQFSYRVYYTGAQIEQVQEKLQESIRKTFKSDEDLSFAQKTYTVHDCQRPLVDQKLVDESYVDDEVYRGLKIVV